MHCNFKPTVVVSIYSMIGAIGLQASYIWGRCWMLTSQYQVTCTVTTGYVLVCWCVGAAGVERSIEEIEGELMINSCSKLILL